MTAPKDTVLAGPLVQGVVLDDIFGNPIANIITEPVTPYKLALYEFICVAHECNRDVMPFTSDDSVKLTCALFGLIQQNYMPFSQLKKYIYALSMLLNKTMFGNFLKKAMTIVSTGDFHIRLDDLLQNPAASTVTRPEKSRLFAVDSYLGLWMKKLSVAWQRLTTTEYYNEVEAFINYLQMSDLGARESLIPISLLAPSIPFEIESSVKARRWIETQLHLLQVCPRFARSHEEIFKYCSLIKSFHEDIYHVHVLEYLVFFRMKNRLDAELAIRRCFDLMTFKPNIPDPFVMPQPQLNVKRMGVVDDDTSVRYAPLLLARLCRWFGDKLLAVSLLNECMQHAQSGSDAICLRLALVELAALDCMSTVGKQRNSGDSENCYDADEGIEEDEKEKEGKIKYKRLASGDAIEMLEKDETLRDAKSTTKDPAAEDRSVMLSQLADIARLMYVIRASRTGLVTERIRDFVSQAACSTAHDDLDSRSRLISEASVAVVSSLRLSHGLWRGAKHSAQSLIDSNVSDGIAPHFETDSQAIAQINIIYALTAEGKWSQALESLKSLQDRFPPSTGWKIEEHVKTCVHLVQFDNAFRLGDWTSCFSELKLLGEFSHFESLLRGSILNAQNGSLVMASNSLQEGLKEVETDGETILAIRMRMQLAAIFIGLKTYDEALNELQIAQELCLTQGLILLLSMVQRRIGVLQLMRNNHEQALKTFSECEDNLRRHGTQLELALLYIGWAKVVSCIPAQCNETYRYLSMGRIFCRRSGFPILEKIVLKELALWFDKKGMESQKNDIVEQFCSLDDQYPGTLHWHLF